MLGESQHWLGSRGTSNWLVCQLKRSSAHKIAVSQSFLPTIRSRNTLVPLVPDQSLAASMRTPLPHPKIRFPCFQDLRTKRRLSTQSHSLKHAFVFPFDLQASALPRKPLRHRNPSIPLLGYCKSKIAGSRKLQDQRRPNKNDLRVIAIVKLHKKPPFGLHVIYDKRV